MIQIIALKRKKEKSGWYSRLPILNSLNEAETLADEAETLAGYMSLLHSSTVARELPRSTSVDVDYEWMRHASGCDSNSRWNSLPADCRQAHSLALFINMVKLHLGFPVKRQ